MDIIDSLFDLFCGQAVNGGLLENNVDSEIWPATGDVYPFPSHSSFQVSLLATPLVNESPTKVWANQIFIPLFIQIGNDGTFARSKFHDFHIRFDNFLKQILYTGPINIPIINFLLF